MIKWHILGVAGVPFSESVIMAVFGSRYDLEHNVHHLFVPSQLRRTLEVLQLLKGRNTARSHPSSLVT